MNLDHLIYGFLYLIYISAP